MKVTDSLVSECLAPFGVTPSASLSASIRTYMELMDKWNRRISLSSLTDTRGILARHFGESLFAVKIAGISGGRLADVGSGAGFPGVPIKLLTPNLELTIIESNTKKAAFLAELVRELRLDRVSILKSRYEELDSLPTRQDFIASRALGNWPEFLAWSKNQLGHNGKLILWITDREAVTLSQNPTWSWRAPVHVPGSARRILLVGSPAAV